MKIQVYPLTGFPSPQLADKAQGLLDLDHLGLEVPSALIVPREFCLLYEHCDTSDRRSIIDDLVSKLTSLRTSLASHIPLLAFRCSTKNRRGTPRLLPDSVLNLGLDRDVIAAARARGVADDVIEDVERNCLAHAEAFFGFIGVEMPPQFVWRPLHEQLESLLVGVFSYFLRVRQESADVAGFRDLIVQQMVFGNLDSRSLTGMCYTRHPYTGVEMDYGHFIVGRQGMSLGGVSSELQRDLAEMESINPSAYRYLKAACKLLESHYHDIRSLEYTAEGERMYLLQNTIGNRTFRIRDGACSA